MLRNQIKMEQIRHFLSSKIREREASGRLRKLPFHSSGRVDLFSNDYLGYSSLGLIRQRINTGSYGSSEFYGSTGSRLLSGNNREIAALEKEFSEFISCEDSLFMPSGFQCNLALFSALGDKDSLFICDKNIHASIKEGVRAGLAARVYFRHNDLEHLEARLISNTGKFSKIYVVTESVFSMDGDMPDLFSMLELCRRFKAALVVDEAHGLGTTGQDKKGGAYAFSGHPNLFARIFPMGKAAGTMGGFCSGSELLKTFLVNFSRPLIYTTAPAYDLVFAADAALNLMKDRVNFERLDSITDYYLRQAENDRIDGLSANPGPIQYYRNPDIDKLKSICDSFSKKNYAVLPILSPTVEKGEERIRIILHSFNTAQEIDQLIDVLKEHSAGIR